MMLLQQLAIFPVALASMYALMVSVCVAGRMTRRTKHVLRFTIAALGFLAFWALLRTVTGDWTLNAPDIGHALLVVIGAAALAFTPRIKT